MHNDRPISAHVLGFRFPAALQGVLDGEDKPYTATVERLLRLVA